MKFPETNKNQVSRLAKRASLDKETIFAILDEARFCTIAYVGEGGEPMQIPTGYIRIGAEIFIHGSVGSHFLRGISGGTQLSISVTMLDALVLARSAFHHSMNYRSVIFFSKAILVEDAELRNKALEEFTEKILPGRWKDIRKPDASEWKKTMVLRLPILDASAKIRQGPPVDDEADLNLPVWAGLLPFVNEYGAVLAAPDLREDIDIPDYLKI